MESENSCAELAAMLKGLSRERIGMEFLNLLGLPDPAPTVARMAELGVLAQILPEAEPAALARLVAEERRQGIAPDPLRRLAGLLPADAPLAQDVAARFRLSGAQKKRLAIAAARKGPENDARALAYRLGTTAAIDRLLLAGASTAALTDWPIPVFPLKGGEIVARGVGAGPDIARILRAVEERWIAEGFPGHERIDSILQELLPG